jgi:hypothetical protein
VVEPYLPSADVQQPIGDFADAWLVDEYFIDASGAELTIGLGGCADQRDYPACLIGHGVVGDVYRYQPVDRYWSIQAVEAGLAMLAGAAILALGAVRLRRRAV